ncbi:MAG: M14 family zinc carboxypeptidase [Planctomycetota bacterium]
MTRSENSAHPGDLRPVERLGRPGGALVLGLLLLFAPQAAVNRGWSGAEDTPAARSDTPATGEAGTEAVRIVVGFDGSCPHDPAGVEQEGPGRFRIFPSWRSSPGIDEEAVGRSTRVGFKVVNGGRAAEPVDLWIDWQYHQAPPKDRPSFDSVGQYMSYRDFVVVRLPGRKDWRTLMADVSDSVAHVRLDAPPGETEIHWHPPYNYADSERFVDSLRDHPLVNVEKIGQSPEGRNLWLLRITDASPRPKKSFLIRARVHAYESASSFCMEGMVRWLLSNDAYAAAALRRHVFHVIPMANPDGVHNGLGSLTAPRGADVCFIPYQPDAANLPLKRAIDRVRPAVAVDLHNWQNKHTDGLLGLDPAVRERFVRFMPDQLEFGKQWTVRDPKPLSSKPPNKELLRTYCERNFEAVTVTFEFPWFGRTTEDMRATGQKAVWALLRALDPPPDKLR